jgi:peptidoglycan biosynthesis protein MviN/MurJ (putative lipid II flippase)
LVYSKVAVFVNIGLGIPFAMMYGALGMAAVAAISELVKSLVVFVLLRMEFGIRYPWKGTFRFLLVGGCRRRWLVVASRLCAAAGCGWNWIDRLADYGQILRCADG